MTGHLVLSTLHTNDAPTTLPRLMDMNIPPFLVAFTTNIIIAQRLVRKNCEHCLATFTLEDSAIKELTKMIGDKKLTDLYQSQGIALQPEETDLKTMTFSRSTGCRRCGDSGYKGRVGIYEVLEVDAGMAELINSRATSREIRDYAVAHDMITMLQDGLIKAKQGITTIEEVLRVTRE
jgi:type II secretory ATPase GspE/PulE/Tfp pilus assembly ATPase PilB-like protein